MLNSVEKYKKLLLISCSVLVVAILIFLVFFSRPQNYISRIRVRETVLNLQDQQASNSLVPARILVFSDLQLGFDYQVSDMDLLIETINNINPDVVVFNGGLIAPNHELNSEERNLLVNKLRKIRPIDGKFAISSREDTPQALDVLFESGFESLSNNNRRLTLNGVDMVISGLGFENFHDSVNRLPQNTLNLAFINNPSYVEDILAINRANTIITAHTFGGQYNLPLYGSIFSELREIPFYRGIVDVEGVTVLNNPGIGINRGSMRFRAPSTVDVLLIK